MRTVELAERGVDEYREIVGPDALEALRAAAIRLRGLRVLHVNSTRDGGGVSELLRSGVPLLRDLGIDAHWRVISAVPEFFEVTKRIHNGLQGAAVELSDHDRRLWHEVQALNARELREDWDLVVVHDPQPLGLAEAGALSPSTRWVWRLHIDSSRPDPGIWAVLRPWLDPYAALVFSLPDFAPDDLPAGSVRVMAPAIDPLLPKNRPMPVGTARRLVARLGIDPDRALLAQVSRLDPWKDPIGVIDAYRLVRKEHAGVQLALLGAMEAADDPEAARMLGAVRTAAAEDPDIHVVTDPSIIGPEDIGAIQLVADVVLQKSQREGFGLTVSEALWKSTPVVGGRAGGIVLQIQDGISGFLVESPDAAAERCSWLLANRSRAREMGAAGRAWVRDRFLVTRLLADELALYAELVAPTRAEDRATAPAIEGPQALESPAPADGAP